MLALLLTWQHSNVLHLPNLVLDCKPMMRMRDFLKGYANSHTPNGSTSDQGCEHGAAEAAGRGDVHGGAVGVVAGVERGALKEWMRGHRHQPWCTPENAALQLAYCHILFAVLSMQQAPAAAFIHAGICHSSKCGSC